METLALGLPFMAAFLEPGAWGRDYCSALDSYENMAGMWLGGEDMARASNRITLHPSEEDQVGLPVPNVTFHDHENDLAMRPPGYKQAGGLYRAVGAARVLPTPPQ